MKCLHLFNGIGGFALAAYWMNWENVAHCEIDDFCNKVMNHHFPNSIQHEDIRATDFSIYRGLINLLTGGFPCQPFSTAGQRKGTSDDRYLWPEMLRAVREIQPGWIVPENVPGLVNWSGGLVFEQVQADLENEGYEVIPVILPACAKNAPHRRDRIWFVAHRIGIDIQQTGRLKIANDDKWATGQHEQKGGTIWHQLEPIGEGGFIANTNGELLQRSQDIRSAGGRRQNGNKQPARFLRAGWQEFPTQSPVRAGDDGIPAGLDTDTISETEWRQGSLVAAGNAIVPAVALEIFKAIEAYDQTPKNINNV